MTLSFNEAARKFPLLYNWTTAGDVAIDNR